MNYKVKLFNGDNFLESYEVEARDKDEASEKAWDLWETNNRSEVEEVEEQKTRTLTMDDILIYFDKKYEGNWDEIFKAVNRKERVDPEVAIKVADEEMEKYEIITMIDDNYPTKYKSQYKPPFLVKKIRKSVAQV